MPPETLDGASQHYDLHRKRLMLSALLRPESRTFGLAYQLALIEFRPLLEKMVAAAAPPDAPTRRLLHMSLANYAAGAIMMPYAPFLEAAERHRYDIDRLCALFGASVEQVAHRLTTLNRANARGIPFFMLGSTPPATSPSASPARPSPSRASAAPARAGICIRPSRRRGGW